MEIDLTSFVGMDWGHSPKFAHLASLCYICVFSMLRVSYNMHQHPNPHPSGKKKPTDLQLFLPLVAKENFELPLG